MTHYRIIRERWSPSAPDDGFNLVERFETTSKGEAERAYRTFCAEAQATRLPDRVRFGVCAPYAARYRWTRTFEPEGLD